ncbi:MAG TPA: DUF4349 domain-containing protein [Pyrinomonadaceae bacterium]|nr:DUF4349 domain-containing protein [Pyrinomonadaceae bacterium]
MYALKLSLLVLSLTLLTGCYGSSRDSAVSPSTIEERREVATESVRDPSQGLLKTVSLEQTVEAQSPVEAVDRKIIRNAELAVEVADTPEAQRGITSIAETHGGFVVTSEIKQRPSSDPNRRELEATLVIRVPAPRFDAALNDIRAVGLRVIHEKASAQDVTEEFIDLEARVSAQRALEAQFLEIMKQAAKIPEALEVQRELANVRTEIEKIEGRQRFLQNQASLSTITVKLQPPTGIVVSTSGFGREFKEAVSDSISVATGILLFIVWFVIVMVPVFLLIILPIGLVLRYLFRRMRRVRLGRELRTATPSE